MLNENKHTLPYTYRKFLSIYQSLYPDIIETEVPSIWQLKYFYDREYSPILKIKSRTSKIEYLKDKRVLYSTVNTHVLGPGSRYQVDATIADIYLVSDSDRGCIIGRPTIYFMMDEFSRMVTGMYVGLENPSYVTSMLVLRMAMSDKVDYCKNLIMRLLLMIGHVLDYLRQSWQIEPNYLDIKLRISKKLCHPNRKHTCLSW